MFLLKQQHSGKELISWPLLGPGAKSGQQARTCSAGVAVWPAGRPAQGDAGDLSPCHPASDAGFVGEPQEEGTPGGVGAQRRREAGGPKLGIRDSQEPEAKTRAQPPGSGLSAVAATPSWGWGLPEWVGTAGLCF